MKVLTHLERLRRHHDEASKTYNEASLLDLSHVLRIWTELKKPLQDESPNFSRDLSFWTATPTKKAYRAARPHEYVFACMPGGVRTYAIKVKGEVQLTVTHPDVLRRFMGNRMAWRTRVRTVGDAVDFESLSFVSLVPEDPGKPEEDWTRKRCTFAEWLGAEVVRMRYTNKAGILDSVTIDRQNLIKRVANTMEGSHAAVAVDEAAGNALDEPVHYLLQFSMAGLPLPYLICLSAAQEVLRVAGKHLGDGRLK
jgi:hypothetical protein